MSTLFFPAALWLWRDLIPSPLFSSNSAKSCESRTENLCQWHASAARDPDMKITLKIAEDGKWIGLMVTKELGTEFWVVLSK